MADKRVDVITQEVDSECITMTDDQRELLNDIMMEQLETM